MRRTANKLALIFLILAAVTASSLSVSFSQTHRDVFFILVDTSKSMNQVIQGWPKSKMETIKESLTDFCKRIPLESEVWVFTFDKGLQRSLKGLLIADESSRKKVLDFIQSISGTGSDTYAWSSLDDVIHQASELILKQPGRVHLFVYTDGMDTQKNGPNLADVLKRHRNSIEAKAIHGSYVAVGFKLDQQVVDTLQSGGFEVLTAFDPEALAPLRANFGWSPDKPVGGAAVQFYDRSLGMIASYEWDFGDGSGSSPDKTPSHRYGRPGQYQVALTVRGLRDRKSTSRQTVTVYEEEKPEPLGSFHPRTATVGQTIVFNDESKGQINGYLWDFGDGTTSDKRNPQHVYGKPGLYEVSLTLYDKANTAYKIVLSERAEISPLRAPTADFEIGMEHPSAGVDIKFTDISSGDVTRVTWDFGDGTPPAEVDYKQPEAKRSVTHRFENKGQYLVKMKTFGPGGETERAREVQVGESQAPAPMFDFLKLGERAEVNPPGEKPVLKVRFEDKSKGNIRKRIWDFGDGTAPVEQTALPYMEHGFGPGAFTVKLTVKGDTEEYSLEKPLQVLPPLTFLERYRWYILPSSLILLGLLGFLGKKYFDHRREIDRRRFKGTLEWSLDGKKWFEESIPSPCEIYTMKLEENLHGFKGIAQLQKDVADEFGEKFLIAVQRDGRHEERDELDSMGAPTRKRLHGMKFRFTKT